MTIRKLTVAAVFIAAIALPAVSAAHPVVDGTLHEHGEMVEYELLFPVADGAEYTYFYETFWAARPDGHHHATDIMAPKMTPVLSPRDGTVRYVNWSSSTSDPFPNPHRCCNLTIDFDDGWSGWFIHLNNDTPGTDDGQAWGIAPGIQPGVRVTRGQLVGWVGDSGNAENTGSHLHFELRDPEGTIVNPYQALVDAPRMQLGETSDLECMGKQVTIEGTDGDDLLEGTPGDDVIHGLGGNDTIYGLGGNDTICGGSGLDLLDGGSGDDRIEGGTRNDVLLGGPGHDVLFGDDGNDQLEGGDGNDELSGGEGKDRLDPGSGNDVVYGGNGRDRYVAGPGINTVWAGPGRDSADYRDSPAGAVVDLGAGTGSGPGYDTLDGIEDVIGSPLADLLIGDAQSNSLRSKNGDDYVDGGPGDDRLNGGRGDDDLDGGTGVDICKRGTTVNCEPG